MKLKLTSLVFLLAVVAVTYAKPQWHQLHTYSFEQYVKDFGKNYSPEEYLQRKSIFDKKVASIMAHNKDETKTWKEGVNHLTDLTDAEYKGLLGYRKDMSHIARANRPAQAVHVPKTPINSLPSSVDWRAKGVITAVKDQGRCGSCWTFATAESIESHWALKTGLLTDLSEQQVLDCTPNPDECGGTGGCQGGTTELAFQRLNQMGGIASEWTYPYRSYFGSNFACRFNTSYTPPMLQVASYKVLPSNEYEPLLEAVATVGPIAISVDASAWGAYESGVFNGCNQTNPDIDHAVLLVGYGTDKQYGDYWLVRNSWSPVWGEQGYIRVKRTSTKQCGTDIHPSDGTGCKNGPPQVTVCGTCGILYDNTYPIIA